MADLDQGKYVIIQPSDGSFLSGIRLDATEDYSVTTSATVTERPVDNGTSVSDHYQVKNKTISFNGVILDGQPFSSTKSDQSALGYVDAITKLMNNAVICNLILPKSQNINSTVVSTFSYSKNKQVGSGLNISISFTQIKLAKRATGETSIASSDKSDALQTSIAAGTAKVVVIEGGIKHLTGFGATAELTP